MKNDIKKNIKKNSRGNIKVTLSDGEIPQRFLNLSYYLNKYLGKLSDPPLDPLTKKPVGPENLAALFPMELIKQEASLACSFFDLQCSAYMVKIFYRGN